MARNDKNRKNTLNVDDNGSPIYTRRQANVINKSNRQISGNINALMDNLNMMSYGIQKTDKIDNLVDDFNSLLKSEISNITKSADGDTTSFITKLFSENNKRIASSANDLEEIFNSDEGMLNSFLNEKYKNRLLKQADLHEVATQLVELEEAITVTRDAIISADIVDGHMSRTITIDNDDMEEDQEDYVPIIEQMEEKFKLQKKIKNFIIPKSLEYGEYFVYCVPYSKIFEDFSREKNGINKFNYTTFKESQDINLYEFVQSKKTESSITSTVMESVQDGKYFEDLSSKEKLNNNRSQKDILKEVKDEFKQYLENVTICNTPIPLPILEEGVSSYREYYKEFVEKSNFEAGENDFTFDKIMKNIDTGVVTGYKNKSNKKVEDDFKNIKDCYIKLIDPTRLLPIEIMNEVIGYYYIQTDDISPLSGILTSTVYYNRYDETHSENNALDTIAETIVSAFDKKFLQDNIKFKKLIVEALNYYKLNTCRIKFQFIPKEYIIPFKINEDENGNGVSIIEKSLFYAKLYLMILLFKIMSIVSNSNDMKVNYIKQSGIEKNVANKIQEIARKKQQRMLTMTDLFSYTTLINKIGQGNEMYIPVGKSGERGIETEILSGQEVQINTDLLEMLKKAYISGTGVPDVLINYLHEAEFAKTLELANTRFQGRVVSFQLDYNEQITRLYRQIARYSTSIPEQVIESMKFNFIQPKYSNTNVTNDLLNNHNTLQEFLVNLYYGQNNLDDPDVAASVKRFKKSLAEERLPMLNFTEMDKMYKTAQLESTEETLNPDNQEEDEEV